MRTLIIETSTEKGLILLSENGAPLRSKALSGGAQLSKTLAQEVSNLLNGEIPQSVAVGTGPGSYTGIRVGAALAKALSYGWKVPLIGFCSLNSFGEGVVLVDARMGGFYALLDKEPILISPTDPRLQNISYITSPHPEIIKKRLTTNAVYRESAPNPKIVAELVYTLFLEDKNTPLELTYLSSP
ncbi:MAG: tRNA (adenosine(37)-N6)-threonylcarbamoyltransferase complex dimerization subunit type 1 TsaB [Chlamydiae bacterium CG10_big_fil_rev_8_21_14_0_10_42_34]|nr:MAG: tRNA (adenosine(37)-N6)-threonylcarbamoyltransferase complex dimerization subunit type 1 TsaB [Chlamydiae bacterium CG10_big_fil_rev_8_21_14_0_10_42_34]